MKKEPDLKTLSSDSYPFILRGLIFVFQLLSNVAISEKRGKMKLCFTDAAECAFNNFQSGTPRSRILLPATYPTPSLDQINCEKTLDCHSSNLSCKGTTKFSRKVGNTEIVYNQMAQLAITTSNLQLWSTKMSFCRLESTSLLKKTKRVLISNLSTI